MELLQSYTTPVSIIESNAFDYLCSEKKVQGVILFVAIDIV